MSPISVQTRSAGANTLGPLFVLTVEIPPPQKKKKREKKKLVKTK